MPLPLVTYTAYLTRNFSGAQSEYNADKFIKAIKGDAIRGYAWIPIGGRPRKLENRNRDDAISWFGEIAGRLIANRVAAPRVLVPIPNSDCVVGVPNSRTARLVSAILPYADGVIWDGLRWAVANPRARDGGPRDADVLYENLRVARRPVAGACIIVDDVATTHGHLKAVAAKLTSVEMIPVLAVAAGQTVHDPVPDPFGWVEVQIEDFEP